MRNTEVEKQQLVKCKTFHTIFCEKSRLCFTITHKNKYEFYIEMQFRVEANSHKTCYPTNGRYHVALLRPWRQRDC